MPEQFTDGNIGAFGTPISPADREVTEASLNKIPDVGLQGYTDSGAYSSNYPSGMVGYTPQDEIRYRQEHEPYNYQPDDDQFVYITKAYLYEIHPLLNAEESKLIKKHELSPLKIKLDTKKGCVYTQFMVNQQGKVIGEYNLLKTEEDEPPDSTPFQLLNADGDDEPDKYGIYNVLIFKFADGVILRNNYDSDKDDPRSVRGHGGIEGHRGPLIWSRGYNTINNLGTGEGIYGGYDLTEDKINLRCLRGHGQISVTDGGDQINIRGNSNNKTWQAVPDDNVSYSNTTLATFADGLLTGTPSNLKVVEVAQSTGSGTTVNTVTSSPSITSTPEALSVSSITPPSGSGLALDTYEYTPTAVSTEALSQVSGSVSGGTDIDLQSVSVTSSSITPPTGSGLLLDTKEYTPTPVSTETLSQATNSVSGGTDISFQAVSLDTQQITPPSGSSLDLETNQYSSVTLGTETVGIDATALKGGDNLTTTPTPLSSTSVPVQATGTKSYTSRELTPHTLTATTGLASGTDVNLQSVPLTPTSIKVPSDSGITLTRKEYTPTTVATETTSVTSSFTGGNNLVTIPTDLDTTPSTVLEFDTKKYTSRELAQEQLERQSDTLKKGTATTEVSLETVPLSTTSITPPSGSGISLDTKTYTSRALGEETLTKEATALKGGTDLNTTAIDLHTTESPIVSATTKTYTARQLDKTSLAPQSNALHGGNQFTCNPTQLNTEEISAPSLAVKTFTTNELGTVSLSKQADALRGGADYTCTPTTMTTKAFSRVEESFNENLQQQSGALKGGTDYTCTPTAMTTKAFSRVEESLNEHLQQQSGTLKGGADYTCNHTDFKVKTFSRVEESLNENLKQQSGALEGGADYTCTPTSMTTKSFTTQDDTWYGGETLTLEWKQVTAYTDNSTIWVLTPTNTPSDTSSSLSAIVGAQQYTAIKRASGNTAETFHLYQSGTNGVTGNNKVLTTDSPSTAAVTLRKDIGTYTGVKNLSDASVYLYSTTGASDTRVYLSPPVSDPVENSHYLYYAASAVSDTKVLTTDSSDTTVTLKKDISDYVGVKNLSAPDVYFYSTTGATDTRVYLSPPDSNTTQNLYFAASPVTGNNKVLTTDSSSTAAVTLRKDISTYVGVKNLSDASVYLYSTTGASDTRVYLSPPASETDSSYNLYFAASAVSDSKVLTTTNSSTDPVTLRDGASVYNGITGISGNSGVLFYTAASTGKQFLEADSGDSNGDTTKVYYTDSNESRNFLSNTTNPSKTAYDVYTSDTATISKYLKTTSSNLEETLRTDIAPYTGITGISSGVSLYEAPVPSDNSSDTFLETAESDGSTNYVYSSTESTTRKLLSSATEQDNLYLYSSAVADSTTKFLKVGASESGTKTLRVGAIPYEGITGLSGSSVDLYKADGTTHKFLETTETNGQQMHIYFSDATDPRTFITSSGSAIKVVTSDSDFSSTNYVKTNDNWSGEKEFMHSIDTYIGVKGLSANTVSVYKVNSDSSHKFLETESSEPAETDYHIYATTSAATDTRFLTTSLSDSSLNLYFSDAPTQSKYLKTSSNNTSETLRSGMTPFDAVSGIADGSMLYKAPSSGDTKFLKTDDSDSTHNVYVSDGTSNMTFLTSLGNDINILTSDTISGVSAVNYVKSNDSSLASAKQFKHTFQNYTGLSSNDDENVSVYEVPSTTTNKFLETTETAGSSHRVYSTDTSTTSTRFLSPSGTGTSLHLYSTDTADSTTKFLKVANSVQGDKTLKSGMSVFNAVTGLTSGAKLYAAGNATTHNFLKSPTSLGDHHVYFSDTASTSSDPMSFVTSSGSSIHVVKSGSSLGSTKFVKTTGTGIDSAKTFKHSFGSYTGVTGLSGSDIHLYSTATADTAKFVKTTDTGASHVYVSSADTQRTFITSVGSAINVLTASSLSDGSSAKFVKTTGANVDGIDSAKTFKHTLGSYTGITGLSAASGIRLYSTDTADTAKFVKTTDTEARHVYISTADNQRTFITSTGSSINVLTKSGTGGINVFTAANTTSQTLVTAVNTTPSTFQTVSDSVKVLKAP